LNIRNPKSKIAQPPLVMRLFIPAKPAAGEIQDDDHQQPDQINTQQIKAKAGRFEQEGVLMLWIDDLAGMEALGEEYNYADEPQQVKVHNVIQERHIAVNDENIGKLSLYFFGKCKCNQSYSGRAP
jgi:hypothetical protein